MEEKKEVFQGFDENDYLNPDDYGDDSKEDEEETPEETEVEEEEVVVDDNEETETEEEKQKKKNAHFAELRRQKEAKEKDEREQKIREQTKLETELDLCKTNPYTDEKIVDEEDLKIYKIQKEIAESGGDPINDLPKKLAEINRKASAERKAQLDRETKEQEEMAKDIRAFAEKHPEVNLGELSNDKEYLEYATDKIGRWTTSEIYESYIAIKGIENAQVKEASDKVNNAIDEVAKKITKVPSTKSNGGKSSKGFLEMTDEEYLQYEREQHNLDVF